MNTLEGLGLIPDISRRMTTLSEFELLEQDSDCFRGDRVKYPAIMVDKERNTE